MAGLEDDILVLGGILNRATCITTSIKLSVSCPVQPFYTQKNIVFLLVLISLLVVVQLNTTLMWIFLHWITRNS
jgi:hypothetical protein